MNAHACNFRFPRSETSCAFIGDNVLGSGGHSLNGWAGRVAAMKIRQGSKSEGRGGRNGRIMAKQVEAAGHSIELRVEDISQLFHTLDPFPFRERDLDKDAEEFIVSWARELPRDRPLRIIVHLPEAQASLPETREIGAAITGYFGYRARIIGLDLNELFRVGRWALAIGVAVLSFSVIIGQTVVIRLAPQPLAGLIAESLLIFGWVANWRPIEIFLYEWWPLVRRRNLYRRLAAAQVELKPYKTDRGPSP